MNLPNGVPALFMELRDLISLDVKGKVVAGLILMVIGVACDGLLNLYRYVHLRGASKTITIRL